MELTRLTWEERAGVGYLAFNRPDRLNAIDVTTLAELEQVLDRAWYSPEVRAVLITGAGRAFCAGADVKEWSETSGKEQEVEGGHWVPKMHRFISRFYRLPKPVVAAVNGVAVGAGCDLALAADIRIASTKARFGEVYIKLGFCPDAGGSFLLPRLIGQAKAAELIYTGRIIDAEEADRLGLLNAVVAPEELLAAADEMARKLAAGPTVAIGLAKENIRQNANLSFEEALRIERRAGEICGATEDHGEGLKAVIEKRDPVFRGR